MICPSNPELLPTPLPISITGNNGRSGKDLDPFGFKKCADKCLPQIDDPDPVFFVECIVDCHRAYKFKKCTQECNKLYENDPDPLTNCMAGCKADNGGFFKQANGFIIIVMLFILYLINYGGK